MLRILNLQKILMQSSYGVKLFTMRGNQLNPEYCSGTLLSERVFLTVTAISDMQQYLQIHVAKYRYARMTAAVCWLLTFTAMSIILLLKTQNLTLICIRNM